MIYLRRTCGQGQLTLLSHFQWTRLVAEPYYDNWPSRKITWHVTRITPFGRKRFIKAAV